MSWKVILDMKKNGKSFYKIFKVCKEVPSFQLYPSLQLDLEKRALKQFQQGARKVHTPQEQ